MPVAPIEFPPFELGADAQALRRLGQGIAGWHAERVGNTVAHVWLRGASDEVWFIAVDQREVRRMFEVFTLGMMSLEELQSRWEQWQPRPLPPNAPEVLRQLLTTRPARPAPPGTLDPWPFASWRTDVLRRAEFIVEGAVGPTVGENPNTQSAARPGQVPSEANAFCEVAVGALFTSDLGDRLLMAADWMPMQMLVSQDAPQIDAFLADCEQIPLNEYIQRLPAAS